MLILSRKKEESFIVNDNVIIKVVEISGDRVKVGVTAPKSVRVMRSELQHTIETNKEAVSAVNTPSNLADFLKKSMGNADINS